MGILQHEFTSQILDILNHYFSDQSVKILESSELLQYLNIKTKAANRGSKTRASFANHYAIYVLLEDYLNQGFHIDKNYDDYEGAQFTVLLKRQRELPFGSKLQNHALNHRLNQEFQKYFPTSSHLPIIRDAKTNRYWINENLIKLNINNQEINIAEAIKDIIDAYIKARSQAFSDFMNYCQQMINMEGKNSEQAIEFVRELLRPNVDARVFEIVSYAILKEYYADQVIYWGWSPDKLNCDYLTLYKTGRTNANDGGIDFVMKPLGRFFQVTETIEVGKYFLDIDKVQKYPITFVVKTEQSVEEILRKIEEQAIAKYRVRAIIKRYLESIEEIINILELLKRFEQILNQNKGESVIKEIILQSRIEFNIESEDIIT